MIYSGTRTLCAEHDEVLLWDRSDGSFGGRRPPLRVLVRALPLVHCGTPLQGHLKGFQL